ncbi:hypothetical protein HMPREF9436_01901 [Faecalibacterium cf. prausnitzii KLE1255]|uniref:Uncharacterized protein n=1 Tax=Faecalibacterium cf. prausnitzii KLE1255 TaxID=748224 RepID=E2ZJQ2_9FIRM|nr:hypothetical protein HMPREF9436_01901 [Faecalibacterium cf. prausnitzii KLE1255]
MHKNCTGHSAQIARGKLCERCPLKPANLPWYNKVDRSILMESLYFYNFLYGSFICSMLIFMHTDR